MPRIFYGGTHLQYCAKVTNESEKERNFEGHKS